MQECRTGGTRSGALRGSAGFTLLELLVVMGLVGVLAGIGIGFLSRTGSDVEVGLAMVRDQVRVAALTARTRRLPTTVMLEPGEDGAPSWVQARVLLPVAQWSMEERERGDSRLIPNIIGGDLEPGRFGMARRAVESGPLLQLETKEIRDTLFDLRDGFALSLDVKLDERRAMTLARLDVNLVLSVDDNLFPEAKVVVADGDRAGGSELLRSEVPIRLHQWSTVTLAHDGHKLTLLVDDREGARRPLQGSLYQTDNDLFVVSPPDAPILGLVDEVRMLAYEFTERQVMPAAVELSTRTKLIEFGRDGRLLAPAKFSLAFGDEGGDFEIDPGGIIQ